MRKKTPKMTITECRNLLREYGLDLYKPRGIDIYYAVNDDMEVKLAREEVTGDPENLRNLIGDVIQPPYFDWSEAESLREQSEERTCKKTGLKFQTTSRKPGRQTENHPEIQKILTEAYCFGWYEVAQEAIKKGVEQGFTTLEQFVNALHDAEQKSSHSSHPKFKKGVVLRAYRKS